MNHKLFVSNPDLLVLRKSKLKEFLGLGFLVVFFTFWYCILLQNGSDQQSKTIWIFYLAPLLSIGEIYRALRVVVSGEIYEFDKGRREVRLNGKRLLGFDDVSRVQIRTIYGSDGPDTYNLSLVKLDEKKHRLNHAKDKEQLTQWADDIADFVGLSVTWKK